MNIFSEIKIPSIDLTYKQIEGRQSEILYACIDYLKQPVPGRKNGSLCYVKVDGVKIGQLSSAYPAMLNTCAEVPYDEFGVYWHSRHLFLLKPWSNMPLYYQLKID